MTLEIFAGIVGSDGHLEKGQAVIRIISKDLDFLEHTVIPLIESLSGIKVKPKPAISGFGKQKFVIAFTSRMLWKTLQEKFRIPKGKKSDSLTKPELESPKEKVDFLLGWFAGDGSVTTDRGKPKLEIWSKSEAILKWFQEVLHESGIEAKIFPARKVGKFLLRIRKHEHVKMFHERFTIPHPQKERKLSLLLS